jgi:hypothetical protein
MGATNLIDQIRVFRWRRQGFDGGLAKASAAQALERTGWMRSVGGAAPYLGLFARAAIPRAQADADAAALRIHELPAARGCTYVVPRRTSRWRCAPGRDSRATWRRRRSIST